MVRRIRPEVLDDAPPAEAAASLQDLVKINHWLGGKAVLRGLLRRAFAPPDQFTVLDVGAASGDMGSEIRRCWPGALVTSVDYRPGHLERTPAPKVVANAFQLPFRDRSFDIVFCSLFLHHFENDRVVTLLREFDRLARRGVVVIDLERHWLARRFMPLTRWLFQWHPITMHDAVRSVEAGFLAPELRDLALEAGLQNAVVERHLPWLRVSLSALRDQS